MTDQTDRVRPASELADVVGGSVAPRREAAVRPYDPDRPGDDETLWELKRAFEAELGGVEEEADETTAAADDEKVAAYDAKLTEAYRDRYLSWVGRCVADGPVVWLATETGEAEEETEVLGYAFLLPERLAMIWDGAVLNELYVVPAARGSGVADALVGAVVERARRQETPMDRLLLDVAPDNDRARAFYERVGFEHWGEMVARDLGR